MVIKNIPQIGDPILRKKAKRVPVSDIQTPSIKKIVADLIDTMRATDLVGMAAPQIARDLRVFVIEPIVDNSRKIVRGPSGVYFNPRIIWKSKTTQVEYEGCGSVMNAKIFGPVRRSRSIKVDYYGSDGKRYIQNYSGIMAVIFQHELDHLNGILFTDLITDNKKIMDYKNYLKYVNGKRKDN